MNTILVFSAWVSPHALLVHFPVVLLVIAPLLILVGALLPPRRGHFFLAAALLLVAVGTATLFLVVPAADPASETTTLNADTHPSLPRSASLVLETRFTAALLFFLFLGIVLIPRILHRTESRLFSTVLPLSFLILYCAGALVLVDTAHGSSRLMDEFGVQSSPSAGPATPSILPETGN